MSSTPLPPPNDTGTPLASPLPPPPSSSNPDSTSPDNSTSIVSNLNLPPSTNLNTTGNQTTTTATKKETIQKKIQKDEELQKTRTTRRSVIIGSSSSKDTTTKGTDSTTKDAELAALQSIPTAPTEPDEWATTSTTGSSVASSPPSSSSIRPSTNNKTTQQPQSKQLPTTTSNKQQQKGVNDGIHKIRTTRMSVVPVVNSEGDGGDGNVELQEVTTTIEIPTEPEEFVGSDGLHPARPSVTSMTTTTRSSIPSSEKKNQKHQQQPHKTMTTTRRSAGGSSIASSTNTTTTTTARLSSVGSHPSSSQPTPGEINKFKYLAEIGGDTDEKDQVENNDATAVGTNDKETGEEDEEEEEIEFYREDGAQQGDEEASHPGATHIRWTEDENTTTTGTVENYSTNNNNRLPEAQPLHEEDEEEDNNNNDEEQGGVMMVEGYSAPYSSHYISRNTTTSMPIVLQAEEVHIEKEKEHDSQRSYNGPLWCGLPRIWALLILGMFAALIILGSTLGAVLSGQDKNTTAANEGGGPPPIGNTTTTVGNGTSTNTTLPPGITAAPVAIPGPNQNPFPTLPPVATSPVTSPTTPNQQPNPSPTQAPVSSPSATPPNDGCVNDIQTTQSCYELQSMTKITVTFVNCQPRPDDWIGIYPANEASNSLSEDYLWIYACGGQSCKQAKSEGTVSLDHYDYDSSEATLTPTNPDDGSFLSFPMDVGTYRVHLLHEVASESGPYVSYVTSDTFEVTDQGC